MTTQGKASTLIANDDSNRLRTIEVAVAVLTEKVDATNRNLDNLTKGFVPIDQHIALKERVAKLEGLQTWLARAVFTAFIGGGVAALRLFGMH